MSKVKKSVYSNTMGKRIRATSGSAFVRREIMKNLPKSIRIEFTSEFTDNGDPIIAITSPDFAGILSEARSNDEAIANVHDAILTYFNVPRQVAKLIEYVVEDVPEQEAMASFQSQTRLQVFKLKSEEIAYA